MNTNLNKEELKKLNSHYASELEVIKSKKLNLDITRGKPSEEQLTLANSIDGILDGNYFTDSKVDTRNYGGLDGLIEAKKLFAPLLDVSEEEILIGGNSSLTLMYQYLDYFVNHSLKNEKGAEERKTLSFICPVPGYDRHFSICEYLGIKMINVPFLNNAAPETSGPDMDQVEKLVKEDPSICGMWNVPKHTNPGGVTYGVETVKRLANLSNLTQNKNFRVIWDNAYAVHDLVENVELESIYNEAKKLGTTDSIIQFASTSKITHAGSGVAFAGMSKANLKNFSHYLSFQTIGPDKVNQLRHVKFFKSLDGLKAHMLKHREILKPKFDVVESALSKNFSDNKLLSWTTPKGGYFVSVDTLEGLASSVVSMCNSLGVKLTPAGSTYPYGKDPQDTNIRIAPSFPKLEDVEAAINVFCSVVGFLSTEKLLKNL